MNPATSYIPETVEALQEWIDKSFSVVVGVPRGYFDIPIAETGCFPWSTQFSPYVHRVTYQVVGIRAKGSREQWEAPMVRSLWNTLDLARREVHQKFASREPIEEFQPTLFLRRALAFETQRRGRSEEHLLSIRLDIPGVTIPGAQEGAYLIAETLT